jgi:hypothetical protein
VFDEAMRPRIREPPGTLLLLRVLKMRNAFVGVTGVSRVTMLGPLPVLVSVSLWTSFDRDRCGENQIYVIARRLKENVPAPSGF